MRMSLDFIDLHITVVISSYPHEKEQAKFSLTIM